MGEFNPQQKGGKKKEQKETTPEKKLTFEESGEKMFYALNSILPPEVFEEIKKKSFEHGLAHNVEAHEAWNAGVDEKWVKEAIKDGNEKQRKIEKELLDILKKVFNR